MLRVEYQRMPRLPLPAPKWSRSDGAFTLLETSVAVALVGIFISFLGVTNSNVLGLLRTAKDNVSASQALQERVEEMRIANWVQITDASYLANTLFAASASSTGTISKPVETITVSAYPAKVGFGVAKIVRQNNVTSVVSSNSALENERMVRVDVNLTWNGFPRNRQRVRAASVLVAKGGITK